MKKGINKKALKKCIIDKLESVTDEKLNVSEEASKNIKKNWRAMAKEARIFLSKK